VFVSHALALVARDVVGKGGWVRGWGVCNGLSNKKATHAAVLHRGSIWRCSAAGVPLGWSLLHRWHAALTHNPPVTLSIHCRAFRAVLTMLGDLQTPAAGWQVGLRQQLSSPLV
jgi:hypothetical protein